MNTPEQERARLTSLYAGMSDGELLQIAQSGDELTAIAQEVLSAELARRGLDPTPPAPNNTPEEEPEKSAPSEEEGERLASVYSGQSDGELEQLAAAGYELSESAHQALEAEIARRGLNLAIAQSPGADVYELNDTVTLRQFRDLPEALLAKGSLESAGIRSYLVDDNMVRMDWFISNLLGGIKLKVRAEDAEAANEILSQPIPEKLQVEGVGEYDQPTCPRCHSTDVVYRELNKFLSYGSAFVGLPIPVHNKAWTCHACGNMWEEENTARSELKEGAD